MGTSGFTSQAFGERKLDESLAILGRGLIIALLGGLLFITFQKPIDLLVFK